MSKSTRKPESCKVLSVQKSLLETITGSEKVEMNVFKIAKETKVRQGPKTGKKWQSPGKEFWEMKPSDERQSRGPGTRLRNLPKLQGRKVKKKADVKGSLGITDQ